MEKTYDPHSIEKNWYTSWEKNNYFAPQGGDESYCIMLPPPNVTGSLHMGHAFQQTLMDVLIRYNRMNGVDTLWQCGTDHAGIATQMVVERQLLAKDISRHDLGRENFVDAVWKWKEESGSTITKQSRRLGTSMDWSRERFTLDDGLSDAVKEVFVRLYDEGLIYRGKRLVNWDPKLHTAISDLEVISEEKNGHLWHMKYPRKDGKGYVIVATTRPETMLGDSAVAVHPDDERYQDLIGKEVELPLTGRTIPVIADDYVDPEFGTGCVKITPAHDFNDYEMGQRHDLPLNNIFTVDAAINDEAPEKYRGLDRYEARKQIVADLDAEGLLDKIDDHKLMVPRGDRSGVVVEPYLTDQWYVKIQPLADPAIKAVEDGDIKFIPENWDKTYFEWMRNIQDWCISRQLWWGHRIPAWYDEEGKVYVGRDESEVREKYNLGDIELRQDDDVLDTWFSSALWPFSTLGWPEKTPELDKFYPTNVLVTGFDIIFFWVARMIMFGLKFMGDVPFKEVYIHGLVRDGEGQKMSKSKGNVLDPIDLIDGIELENLIEKRTTGLMQPQKAPKIEKATRKHFPEGIEAYGTDSLRFTFASLATQGRFINFEIGRIQGYRNFCNKLWNATRYILMMCDEHGSLSVAGGRTPGATEAHPLGINNGDIQLGTAEQWIYSRFSKTLEEVTKGMDNYRFDLASQAMYEFTWDQYCDWYVELSKTTLNSETASDAEKRGTLHTLINVLEGMLRMMHPLMPFITEELWQKIAPMLNKDKETIMLTQYPHEQDYEQNSNATAAIEWVKQFILGVRRIRAERDISPGKELSVKITGGNKQEQSWLANNEHYIKTFGKVESIEAVEETPSDAVMAIAGDMTILVPLADIINPADELARINKELGKVTIEIEKLSTKLANKGFTERAPEAVVNKEREKLTDLQSSLVKLKEQEKRIQSMI